ncbi:CheR family methyltransferase [Sphingomonas sp.]|uniref:CheR family methyltransferase n=1 Tax=Sphingomonas sp. TaxID=28214 RepID=UPI003FA7B581
MHRAIVAQQGSQGAAAAISALLEERTGQQIAASRAWRIDAVLKPLLRTLGIESVDALASRAILDPRGTVADSVVDALLNQETSFFRDPALLDLVADAIVARRTAVPGRRLRIWSAGCATGQEPLSLAMLLDERGLDESAVEIVATDVSAGAIARARSARFSQFEIQRGLAVRRMMRWFDGEGVEWTAQRALVRRIQFRRHNLVCDPPPAGSFDMILCRNVLLYFGPEVRSSVFGTLAVAARPDGLLVLGAGETVIGQTADFVPAPDWRGLYRRKAAA